VSIRHFIENKRGLLIPLSLFVVAFLLRIIAVSTNPITGDEPFTIFYSQQSLGELFDLFNKENNPPLHFLMLHFWMKLFGTSILSVRFLSVLFGALTVIPLFKIGNSFFDKKVGVTTALLFTLANLHIGEAHDARVYTLLVFLCTYLYYFFFQLLKEPDSKSIKIWYIITAAFMLYAHYLSGIILFTQFITVIMIKKYRSKSLKQLFFVQAIAVMLFIPFLKVFITRLFSASQNESWIPTPSVESLYGVVRELFNQPVVAVMAIIAMIGFVMMLSINRKKK